MLRVIQPDHRDKWITTLQQELNRLKCAVTKRYGGPIGTNVYSCWNFILLITFMTTWRCSTGRTFIIHPSSFKHFNIHIKEAYKGAAKSRTSRMAKTVHFMPVIVDTSRDNSSGSNPWYLRDWKRGPDAEYGTHLVRYGVSLSVTDL